MKHLTETEYSSSTATNYSLLKALSTSPLKAKEFIDNNGHNPISTPSLDWGSLIDCLITTPADFDAQFYVAKDINIPQDKMLLWATEAQKKVSRLQDLTDEIILYTRTLVGYDARLKDPTAIARFKEEALPYLRAIESANGRKIIDEETYKRALKYIDHIKQNYFLSEFFSRQFTKKATYEMQFAIEHQVSINIKYPITVNCKIKIDEVIFTEDYTKACIIDYKTCENVDMFIANYFKYRYYLQGSFYPYILHEAMPKLKSIEMYFIALGQDGRVLIYHMGEEERTVAMRGSKDFYGKPIKGIYQLLYELDFHRKNNLWEYTEEQYNNKGIIQLNELTI